MQVLLVTAGYDGDFEISSTEILEMGASDWKEVAPYPMSVSGLAGATINNIVYMTG